MSCEESAKWQVHYSAAFEIVVRDMPKSRAHSYVTALKTFFEAGWSVTLGFLDGKRKSKELNIDVLRRE